MVFWPNVKCLCKCFYKLREQLLIQSIFPQVRSPIRSPKQMQQELHSAHSVQVLCTMHMVSPAVDIDGQTQHVHTSRS